MPADVDTPAVIQRYLEAHDAHDGAGALACFTPTATVVDEDTTHVGAERIEWWLANAASEFTYTRTLTGTEVEADGSYVVRNHLSGDFPGGEVDLRYRFRLRDGLIDHLEIAP